MKSALLFDQSNGLYVALKEALLVEGINLSVASTLEDALLAIRNVFPFYVFMDYWTCTVADCDRLIIEIRKRWGSGTKIILLSDGSMRGHLEHTLYKPFDLTQLKESLK